MVRRPSRLEQALVPRTVAGRGLKVDRVAWEGESGNRGAVRGREEAETKSQILRVGTWAEQAPSSGI